MSTEHSTDMNQKMARGFGSKGWVLLIFILVGYYANSAMISDTLNVSIPVFSEMRGWDTGLLYSFSTIATWVSVVGMIFLGWIGSRVSPKLITTLCLAVAGVAVLFWGHVTSPVQYFIVLALVCVAANGYCYVGNSNLLSNWFPRKKGMAMGIVTIGLPLSAATSVIIFSILMGKGGLPAAYTVFGVILLVLAVLSAVVIRSYPEQTGAYPDNDHSFTREQADQLLAEGLEYSKTSPWTVKKLLQTKQVWQIAVGLGVLQLFCQGVMSQFIPRVASLGFTQEQAIPMMSLTAIIGCVGSVICGKLDSVVGTKKAGIITLLWSVAAIAINLIPSMPTLYLSFIMIGMTLGGASNYIVSATASIWGRYDFQRAYAVILPIVNIIGGAGYAIVGILASATGGYTIPYMVLIVLLLIGTVLVHFLDTKLIGRS